MDEEQGRSSNGHVFERKHGLRRNDSLLEAKAGTDSEEDGVANPDAGAGVGFEGGDQASADGHEDCGEVEEGCVPSCFADSDTGSDGENYLSKNQGQCSNAGFFGCSALNGLEPDGEVKNDYEEGASDADAEHKTRDHGLFIQDAKGYGSGIAFPILHGAEADEEQAKEDEEHDDSRVGPGVLGAAPLESEEEADDCGQEEDGANRVELLEAGSEADGAFFLTRGRFEEEGYGDERDGTNWEVDVETPEAGLC